jgi:uncharacterized repeat protein (TIGR03803 family)
MLTTLHNFVGTDGAYPLAGLAQATDGNFYGTTSKAGAYQTCLPENYCGTVFKITPSGMLTTLYNFAGQDGASPQAALLQASDGNFYGTTYTGGSVNLGTAFRITPSGTLNTLHNFCTEQGCFDGIGPWAELVQGHDRGHLFRRQQLPARQHGTFSQIVNGPSAARPSPAIHPAVSRSRSAATPATFHRPPSPIRSMSR